MTDVRHVIRYDDFGAISSRAAEEALFEAARDAGYSLTVGVIPFALDLSALTRRRSASLTQLPSDRVRFLMDYAAAKVVDVALHGYAHLALAPVRGLAEFGDGVSVDDQARLIEAGRRELEDRLQQRIELFIPPWNSISVETARLVQDAGLELSGGRSTLDAAASARVACTPCEASLAATASRIRLASRASGSVVGTIVHDYDFVEAGRGGTVPTSQLRDLMAQWSASARPARILDINRSAESVATTVANQKSLSAVLGSRIPGRLTNKFTEVFWSKAAATRLARVARLLP